MELNALMSSMFYMQTLSQKYNPFHKELVEQNWEKARIVLHTLVKDDTEFHRLLIEEKMEFNATNLLLWLLSRCFSGFLNCAEMLIGLYLSRTAEVTD